MDARYLRIKNQAKHQHYDPTQRQPPWIKLYNNLLGGDDAFAELSESEQWQLVRIWLVASRSSRFTIDDDGRLVQVVADDEQTIRRAIQSVKKVPIAKFVREGWLIPVEEHELVDPDDPRTKEQIASAKLARSYRAASKTASTPLSTEVQKEPKAVTSQRDAARAKHVNGNGPGLEYLTATATKEMR